MLLRQPINGPHAIRRYGIGDHTMLFVANTHDDLQEAWRYYAQLSAKHVDGIIAVSHDTSGFLAPDGGPSDGAAPLLPIVSVNWPDASGYAVTMDSASAGYQGTQHLLAHGHRRVGLISWERETPNVRLTDAGYRRALREAVNLPPRSRGSRWSSLQPG